jgi:hypothetical protein
LAAADEELTAKREFVCLIDFGLARTAGEADLTAIRLPSGPCRNAVDIQAAVDQYVSRH